VRRRFFWNGVRKASENFLPDSQVRSLSRVRNHCVVRAVDIL
jgi:hypothetical protein